MKKIKLFTHTDLDGIGCAILAYLAFGSRYVDVEYCGYNDVDEKVDSLLLNINERSMYEMVYITDISIDEELVSGIDTWIIPCVIRLFDHHATALGLNQFGWCEVKVDNNLGIKTSGTELFYNHLSKAGCFDRYSKSINANIHRFVEIVRDWDTWRWKELGEEGVVCKQVNDLFYIYGRDEFIEEISARIRFFDIPGFTEIDMAHLSIKQKDIDIYVAEKDKQLRVATDQFGKAFGYVFAERYFSELGNRLCEMHPEIEYVSMIDISKGFVSFRSVREDVDLGGEIAHSLGGGGHKKAAGSHFDAVEVGKFVSWSVLNTKPDWSDIMPQYLGEPVKKED